MKHLDDIGEADNTIVVFSTDNGAEVFTWPDGGMTPFRATRKALSGEGGFRVPCDRRVGRVTYQAWAPSRTASSPDSTGSRLFLHAAGNPEHQATNCCKGVKLECDRTVQEPPRRLRPTRLALLEGTRTIGAEVRSSTSVDHILARCALITSSSSFFSSLGAGREKKTTTDMPTMVNIRQDPFERTPSLRGESLNNLGGGYMNDFYAREFWRFVEVQRTVTKLAETAVEFPPMQAPATFNLDSVKRQVEEMIKQSRGR